MGATIDDIIDSLKRGQGKRVSDVRIRHYSVICRRKIAEDKFYNYRNYREVFVWEEQFM